MACLVAWIGIEHGDLTTTLETRALFAVWIGMLSLFCVASMIAICLGAVVTDDHPPKAYGGMCFTMCICIGILALCAFIATISAWSVEKSSTLANVTMNATFDPLGPAPSQSEDMSSEGSTDALFISWAR